MSEMRRRLVSIMNRLPIDFEPYGFFKISP
jgi:hypothetical protein